MGMLIKCYVMLDALIMTDRTKTMLCPVGHPCLGRKKECTPGGEHSLKTRSLMGEAPFPPPPPLLINLPQLQTYQPVKKRIHPVIGLIRLRDLLTLHTAVVLFQFHHNLLPKAPLTTSFHSYHLSMGTVLG